MPKEDEKYPKPQAVGVIDPSRQYEPDGHMSAIIFPLESNIRFGVLLVDPYNYKVKNIYNLNF